MTGMSRLNLESQQLAFLLDVHDLMSILSAVGWLDLVSDDVITRIYQEYHEMI